MVQVAEYDLRPTVYSGEGIAAAAAAATQVDKEIPVHLKIDTGMRRVGAEPELALTLAKAISEKSSLSLDGLWTHCAVADIPSDPFTTKQLESFDRTVEEIRVEGIGPSVQHAANSALAINNPEGRYDLVRCGLAIYGLSPLEKPNTALDLRPAMKVRSEVSYVKTIEAGDSVSYGLSWTADQKLESLLYQWDTPMGCVETQVTVEVKSLLVGSDILLLETLRWINSWSIAAKIT